MPVGLVSGSWKASTGLVQAETGEGARMEAVRQDGEEGAGNGRGLWKVLVSHPQGRQ